MDRRAMSEDLEVPQAASNERPADSQPPAAEPYERPEVEDIPADGPALTAAGTQGVSAG
jgi:hypothetical protein